MLYFQVNAQLEVVAIQAEFPEACQNDPTQWARDIDGNFGPGWLNRNDISANPAPLMFAQAIADSASRFSGRQYLMADSGYGVSPRYNVVEAPQVGDEVSMAFNGDYYPAGRIVKISPSYGQIRVEGECGVRVFYRRQQSGAWMSQQTWSLVPGVISRLNPEF